MAIFGDVGRIFGLGTAQETVQSLTGSEILGRTAGVVSRGISGLSDRQQGTQQGQSVAISQATQTMPQESQESGTFTNLYGGMIQPAVVRFPSQMPTSTQQSGFGVQPAFLKPALQLGGLAVGAAIDLFFIDPITGETKRRRITRKFKSQVKQSVELVGLEETARLLETTTETVVAVLLKRFRNDGPYITKAAVRKTRTTVRKMQVVCDLSKEIGKLAGSTTRKRTTTSRAASTTSRKTNAIAIN
jgi:hypothetical protein